MCDGGFIWEQVFFVSEDVGVIDVVLWFDNLCIFYVVFWEFVMLILGCMSGGLGSGFFCFKDGGDIWECFEGNGFLIGFWGKIGFVVSVDKFDCVWVFIEMSLNSDFVEVGEFQGVFWRFDDGGDSWLMINCNNYLMQWLFYYICVVVVFDNVDEIIFMVVCQSLLIDGGKMMMMQNLGWDYYDLWIDFENFDCCILGYDGGVFIIYN